MLDPEESLALRLLSKQLGVTTNDLLLRDLLIVLRRWNSGHGGTARGRFRINVPVNVRTRADAALPAANRIGYGFVSVSGGNNDPARLLAVVGQKTRRIKEWKLGLYFLGGLVFARRIPSRVPLRHPPAEELCHRRVEQRRALRPAGQLDDPGRWTCGPLTLESVTGAAAARRDTGRLHRDRVRWPHEVQLAVRPAHVQYADTRALVDDFAAQVRETLARET